MSMHTMFPHFFDELEKIAISTAHSSFTQSRKGRRSIRAHNLLKKDTMHRESKEDKESQNAGTEEAKDYETETGTGFQDEGMGKEGAMAADLRKNGIGGVQRPPFATEDSKQFANNQLSDSLKPGTFKSQTQPKNLVRPGPSVRQTATLPTG